MATLVTAARVAAVVAHLRPIPRLIAAGLRGAPVPAERRVPGTWWIRLLLAATIVAGAVLAIATIRYAQPWVHFFAAHQSGGEG